MSDKAIQPLPKATTSLLRSTLVVPSLPAVLIELVQNSLDAQATSIQVVLALDRWSISCQDDGVGFSRDDLARLGRERYLTSKLGQDGRGEIETFGFRGEALASLADLGMLEILTKRNSGDGESYSLIVRGGELVSHGVARTERVAAGTTVWVRDIYYKWPVRRRPFATPSARQTLIRSLRQALCTLSLLHPSVSFTLTEAADGMADSGGAARLVQVGKSPEGVLGRWRQLWGRAGVENAVSFSESDSEKDFTASGFFSTTASHSKSSQFVFVNHRPLATSPIHKLVNSLFQHSSFARHAASHLVAPAISPAKLRVHSTSTSEFDDSDTPQESKTTKRSRKSPKKSVERHPIFVLHLQAPPAMVDVTLEPEKRVVEFQDEKRVHAFIETVVKTFLRSQGYVSTPLADTASSTPPNDSPETPAPPEDDQLVVKRTKLSHTPRGHSTYLDLAFDATSTAEASVRPADRPNLTELIESSAPQAFPHDYRSAFSQSKSTSPTRATGPSDLLPDDDDAPVKWTDPTTFQTYLLDRRTGNTWKPPECLSCSAVERDAPNVPQVEPQKIPLANRENLVDKSSLRRSAADVGDQAEMPDWIKSTLQNWENPVFEVGEAFIPSLRPTHLAIAPLDLEDAAKRKAGSRFTASANLSRSETSAITAFFQAPGATDLVDHEPARFSRSTLRGATFVAQVDRKFLLVRLAKDDECAEETLVMVDQHAADERVRVERFLKELVNGGAENLDGTDERVKVWTFDEPVPVVVSRTEALVVHENLAEFARWGIGIDARRERDGKFSETNAQDEDDLQLHQPEDDYAQVYLLTVPLVVADRLKIEVQLRQELIRSHVSLIVERGTLPSSSARGKASPWASVLRDCPPVLLDLVNSKACRGAIMFNDSLTPAQASSLIARLAETAFPFQCAHGRPSLVPLVNMPSASPAEESIARGHRIDWSLFKA